jgi:hypothetical protein
MVFFTRRKVLAGIGLVATFAWSSSALAEDTAADAADAPRTIAITRTLEPNGAVVVQRWPDKASGESAPSAGAAGPAVLFAGLVTFALSYVPSVMTASESGVPVDRQLFVPVAGPWIDLGTRPTCGLRSVSCSAEVGNQALLIADGFFQGLAVVQILAGLTMVVRVARESASAVAKVEDQPSVRVRPAALSGGGYGLAAIGKF